MVCKFIYVSLLGFFLALHAAADPNEAEVVSIGRAMSKFMPAMPRPSPQNTAASLVSDGISRASSSSIAQSDFNMQPAILKVLADMKTLQVQNQEMNQRLQAIMKRLPQAGDQGSLGSASSFGWLAGFIASVSLTTSVGVVAVRKFSGHGQHRSQTTLGSQISLVPQRAGLVVASGAAGPSSSGNANDSDDAADVDAVEAGKRSTGDVAKSVTDQFAGAVRFVTGNKDYQFGDVTKKVVKDLTGKDASEYRFGDITKTAVKNYTGKDEYEFGDITKKVLNDADRTVSGWRSEWEGMLTDDWENGPLGVAARNIFGDLASPKNRQMIRAILFGGLQLGTTVLLAYGLVANAVRFCSIAWAWTFTSQAAGTSPLAAAGPWSKFIATHTAFGLAWEPLLLPLRALGTLLITPRYVKLNFSLQRRLKWRERRPLLSAALVLGLTYSAGTAITAVLAGLGVGLVGMAVGVPMFR